MTSQFSAQNEPRRFSDLARISAASAVGLVIILAVGLVLRLYLLEARPFWGEASSWVFARLTWSNFWKEMWRDEADMVFYYILLRGWLLLGDSEWLIRSFSVLFGVATLPMLYLAANRLFGKWTALASTALLAVHAFHIRYSQEARSYSLLTFLLVLSVYFFIRSVESPSDKRCWAAYLLSSVLACYCHFFPFLVVVAQWLSLDLVKLRQIDMKKVMIIISIFVLSTTPIGLFLLFQTSAQLKVQTDWIPPLTWKSLVDFAYLLTGNGGRVLLLLYVLLSLLSLVRLFFANPNSATKSGDQWHLRLVALWLVLPLVVVFGISLVKPLFQPRFLLMCVPPLTIMAGASLGELRRFSFVWQRIAYVALVAMLALSAWGNFKEFRMAKRAGSSFHLVTQYVLDHKRPTDALFFLPSPMYMQFNFYANRQVQKQGEVALPVIAFPKVGDVPPGEPIVPTAGDVEEAIRDHERVWLVLHLRGAPNSDRPKVAAMVRATLLQRYQLQEEQVFPGQPTITVALYVRTAGEPHSY